MRSLSLERCLFVTIPSRDCAKGLRRRIAVRIEGRGAVIRWWTRGGFLACFDASTVLFRQDVRSLQVFIGVNVWLLLGLLGLAGLFLAGGLSNVRGILRVRAQRTA